MMRDGQLFRVVEENCWSPEARIKEMNDTGMHYQGCFMCMPATSGWGGRLAFVPQPISFCVSPT